LSRRRLFALARIAVSAALLVGILHGIDWNLAWETAAGADPPLLLLAPVIWLASLLVGSLRWRLILRDGGVSFPLGKALPAYLVGAFYNLFLPGAVGGDAARAAVCSAATGCGLGRATGSVLLERLSGLAAVVVFILGTSLVFPGIWSGLLHSGSPCTVALAAGMVLLAAAAAVASRGLLVRRASRWHRGRILPALGRMLRTAAGVSLPALLLSILLSMLFQGARFMGMYALSRSIGLPLRPEVFFSLMPLVYLATLVPVSLGGLGIREGTLVVLLGGLGVAASQAVTLSLLIYMNQVLLAVAGGLLQAAGVVRLRA